MAAKRAPSRTAKPKAATAKATRGKVAKPKPKPSPRPAPRKPPLRRPRWHEPEAEPESLAPALPAESVGESLLHIAEDAVIILRHELRAKAELAQTRPGWVSMSDCIALLRLTAELGEAAQRGDEGQSANYDRLTPEERETLAGLLLKVDYA